MLPREAANIHSEKHNILVFLSNTLFSPFYVPSPSLFLISKNGRYLGGTWEERFRFTFVTSSLSNRYQSEVLSKTKRSSIEDLSKIYRRPIEHLSKTYRRSIEHLSKTYRRERVSTVLSTSIWFVWCAEEWAYRQVSSFWQIIHRWGLYKECQEHQGWCHTRHNTAQEQSHRFHSGRKAFISQGALFDLRMDTRLACGSLLRSSR